MQAFIDMAVSQLGISSGDAQTATGGLMSLIQDQLGESEFGQLASAIPGASDLASQFSGNSGGGLLGGLTDMLGDSGGALGSIATITSMLSDTDLDMSKLSGLGELLMGFIQDNAGDLIGAKVKDMLPGLLSQAA